MPRSIPRDPVLYAEAVERVRSGARHKIIQQTVNWDELTGDCQACGRNVKIYQSSSFAICANYYVDRLVRRQLIDQGERVPKTKRGRLPKDQIQIPIKDVPVVEQYLPWEHREDPPIGFDPSQFRGTGHLTEKIDTYLDAQAAAQGQLCFMCAMPLKMIHSGGDTQVRGWGFARVRMPSAYQQVVIMDEVFCNKCIERLESHAGLHAAIVERLAQVLAHGQRLIETSALPAPLASPVLQQRIVAGIAASSHLSTTNGSHE